VKGKKDHMPFYKPSLQSKYYYLTMDSAVKPSEDDVQREPEEEDPEEERRIQEEQFKALAKRKDINKKRLAKHMANLGFTLEK